MNQTFKVGDKVYYPIQGNEIFTLTKSNDKAYPLSIDFINEDGDDSATFTKNGKYYSNHSNVSIFHVTEENRKLLNSLYGIQFEEPKSFLDHHLSLGSKVLCLVAKKPNKLPNKIWELDSNSQFIDVIVKHTSDNEYLNDGGCIIKWQYVYPIEVTSTGQINYLS